jgi:hypothetical protein
MFYNKRSNDQSITQPHEDNRSSKHEHHKVGRSLHNENIINDDLERIDNLNKICEDLTNLDNKIILSHEKIKANVSIVNLWFKKKNKISKEEYYGILKKSKITKKRIIDKKILIHQLFLEINEIKKLQNINELKYLLYKNEVERWSSKCLFQKNMIILSKLCIDEISNNLFNKKIICYFDFPIYDKVIVDIYGIIYCKGHIYNFAILTKTTNTFEKYVLTKFNIHKLIIKNYNNIYLKIEKFIKKIIKSPIIIEKDAEYELLKKNKDFRRFADYFNFIKGLTSVK